MGERYLVVGGSSGIGAAVVDALVAVGGEVTRTCRHPERIPDKAGVSTIAWDSTQPLPSSGLPEVLDGVVYCPGSIRLRPFAQLKDADFREDMEVNLLGAVRALQSSLPSLQRAPSASVVLFSTVAVQTGMPYHTSVASAKGAVEGLARALAAELAPRIRGNVVAPTITDTPLAQRLLSSEERRRQAAERHPLKRIARPEEVARTVLWLLRDAPLVTGEVIRCDAGLARLRVT